MFQQGLLWSMLLAGPLCDLYTHWLMVVLIHTPVRLANGSHFCCQPTCRSHCNQASPCHCPMLCLCSCLVWPCRMNAFLHCRGLHFFLSASEKPFRHLSRMLWGQQVFGFLNFPPLSSCCSNTDVHTVASLLKLYLRELPEPVIPFAKYEDFLSCGQLLSKDEGEVSAPPNPSPFILNAVLKLPDPVQAYFTTLNQSPVLPVNLPWTLVSFVSSCHMMSCSMKQMALGSRSWNPAMCNIRRAWFDILFDYDLFFLVGLFSSWCHKEVWVRKPGSLTHSDSLDKLFHLPVPHFLHYLYGDYNFYLWDAFREVPNWCL